ncbi:MAG: cytochrome C, partial [Bdellovibrionota bacterium]
MELRDLPMTKYGLSVRYGYALLADTPKYIGPDSKRKFAGNSMACANCHMDVGARPLGNSWLDAHSLYPQYREREGKIQTLADRVNTCLQHNLAGKPLPVDGDEMKAITLYYRWL